MADSKSATDFKCIAIDDLPQIWDGWGKLVRAGLGISAFGVQVMFAVPVRVDTTRDAMSGEPSVTTNDLPSAERVSVAPNVTVFETKFAPLPSDTPPPLTVPASSLTFASSSSRML